MDDNSNKPKAKYDFIRIKIINAKSQFYTCLNLPLENRLFEIGRMIDLNSPSKDLEVMFPLLVTNIFGDSSFNSGWGLKTATAHPNMNRSEFCAIIQFLEPQGPMFRLCYKLLQDPQCKYNLPVHLLPAELQCALERGRCTQFYADLRNMDIQYGNMKSLALNPFDYYIFNFALHLLNDNETRGFYDSVNTAYFALVCDYLIHFLPVDPSVGVQPSIPYFRGKVPATALQTANRSFGSESLLLKPDLLDLNNQRSSQSEPNNEVWRSETVLQVFIDLWMSIDNYSKNNETSISLTLRRNFPVITSSTERVRIVRVLVKHIHSYASNHSSDSTTRSAALRKYASQIMCVHGYHYVKYLIATWPLDASFRTVMELWLSLIQPWRYAGNYTIDQYRSTNNNPNTEDLRVLDPRYTQFIAENFPSYMCIFQNILPRFTKLDLSTPKNALMLFRLGKVFSKPYLVTTLRDLEETVVNSNDVYLGAQSNTSYANRSYLENNMTSNRYGTIAKQALSEMNLSPNFYYEPLWSENMKSDLMEFLKLIMSAKNESERIVEECNKKINEKRQGIWSSMLSMLGRTDEEEIMLEECKKVPQYLSSAIQYFSHIFDINDNIMSFTNVSEDSSMEQSSYMNTSGFPNSVIQKLRTKSTDVHYMGDPDLAPIASYESTVLVRMLYQLATKINEVYRDEFQSIWTRDSFLGIVSRQILQRPCSIQTYVKDSYNRKTILTSQLPPRLSLRRLGSHAFVAWMTVGYLISMLFGYNAVAYLFLVFIFWSTYIFIKATAITLGLVKSN